jgi:hypothetical protein
MWPPKPTHFGLAIFVHRASYENTIMPEERLGRREPRFMHGFTMVGVVRYSVWGASRENKKRSLPGLVLVLVLVLVAFARLACRFAPVSFPALLHTVPVTELWGKDPMHRLSAHRSARTGKHYSLSARLLLARKCWLAWTSHHESPRLLLAGQKPTEGIPAPAACRRTSRVETYGDVAQSGSRPMCAVCDAELLPGTLIRCRA